MQSWLPLVHLDRALVLRALVQLRLQPPGLRREEGLRLLYVLRVLYKVACKGGEPGRRWP